MVTIFTVDVIGLHMVTSTQRDDMTWFACEVCGLLFGEREEARTHETSCEGEEPSYLQ